MKRIIVLTIVAVFGSVLSALAFDGASTSGSGQVVVDRSTRDKTLNDYALLTRDAIQRAWNTPQELSASSPLKGKIAINYIIAKSGNLESIHLVRGSGIAEMDQALLRAIRSAAPFPMFPDEIPASSVLIRANFIVADLPTVPITTVQHNIGTDNPLDGTSLEKPEKKYNWGVSAGSANQKEDESEKGDAVPAPPPAKKYHWGL